jgi:cephalosporin hydroxylase
MKVDVLARRRIVSQTSPRSNLPINRRRWLQSGFGLLRGALRYVFWALFGRLLVSSVVKKFASLANEISDVDEAIRFAFSFRYRGIAITPSQLPEEIADLLYILSEMRPKIVLEVGTAQGGTLFLFTRVASLSALVISLDLPRGPFSGGLPKQLALLYRSFARNEQSVYPIRADSHEPGTIEKIKRITDGQKIDFLFIDGDHSYDGVKRDFDMYSPLVKKGGMIAFHDISCGPQDRVGGVPVFWKEIEHRYRNLQISKDCEARGFGIGVLYV